MSDNTVWFPWRDMADLSGLGRHIRFAGELIEKYRWDAEIQQELSERLERIERKQQDQCLNLSVIGGFSSGKSTFINALLRLDLLSAGILQGTTVAATVLEYGRIHQVELKRKGRKKKVFTFPDLAALKQNLDPLIDQYSAGHDLEQVTVLLPSESLKNGNFRIIDTPGLDATERWHEEVTVRTLRETADLSIILVDAVRPMPDSLCNFISEHLQEMLPQCAFVVTKTDLISPRERNMMLKFVKKTAMARFGTRDPLVLQYASPAVINSFAPGSFPPSRYEQDMEVALESEQKLLEHMAHQRTVAQSKKLLHLMDRIYGSVSQQMETLDRDFRERLALLLRTRQADLSQFVARQKQLGGERFTAAVVGVEKDMQQRLEDLAQDAKKSILDRIEAMGARDTIRDYMKRQLEPDCTRAAFGMGQRLVQALREHETVNGACETVLQQYEEEFRAQFRQLDLLPPAQTGRMSVKMPKLEAEKLMTVTGFARQESSQEGKLTAAVSKFMGRLSGGWGGPSLEEVKRQTKADLDGPLSKYFDQVVQQLKGYTGQFLQDTQARLGGEMDRYLAAYHDIVDRWIDQEEDRRAELESRVCGLKEDMSRLEDRRVLLRVMEKKTLSTELAE